MVVCLLGAGASAEAGPLTSAIMADDLFRWAFSPVGWEPPTYQNAKLPNSPLKTAEDILLAVWHYLTLLLKRQPNIEELAAAFSCIHPTAQGMNLLPPILELPALFRDLPAESVEVIELDLMSRLKETWVNFNADATGYLAPLVALESLFATETLKVFTLNYDTVIECLCSRLRIGASDGFRDGSLSLNAVPVFRDTDLELYADPPIKILMWHGEEEPNRDVRVELFKLHGSVNWFRRAPITPNSRVPYDVYHSFRVQKRDGLTGVNDPDQALAKLNARSYTVLWDDSDGRWFYPAMVFGTVNKMQPSMPYIRLYDWFYRYLRRTRVCVIVGYSFQDDYVNRILIEAFNRQGSASPVLNIVIVNRRDKSSLLLHLGFKDNTRIWQLVGDTSAVLTDGRFGSLVGELALNGASKLSHNVIV